MDLEKDEALGKSGHQHVIDKRVSPETNNWLSEGKFDAIHLSDMPLLIRPRRVSTVEPKHGQRSLTQGRKM